MSAYNSTCPTHDTPMQPSPGYLIDYICEQCIQELPNPSDFFSKLQEGKLNKFITDQILTNDSIPKPISIT